ncbi:MAG: hypothetical protein H0U29_14095 [Acidimicrobiia bacterium]|nr:hypothetical protein [Acidimicrobiia bacterium]
MSAVVESVAAVLTEGGKVASLAQPASSRSTDPAGDADIGWVASLRSVRTPLLMWAGLVAAAIVVGLPLRVQAKVGAPPLTGRLAEPFLPMVPLVLAIGLWLARRVPRWCASLSWRRLLLVAALLALGWGVALALVRGPSGLDRGLSTRFEYPAVVEQVDRVGVGPFIDTFTDPEVLAGYPIHVQGHPLGAALTFVGLDRVGLGGTIGGSAFLLVVGATTVPAVLITMREVAGERRARQGAPFLILAPALIWTVTSADALYAAVGAWAVALVVLATGDHRSPSQRIFMGVSGGMLFGLGIHLSYGLPPLVLVPVAVAVARRRWSVLGWAALGGAAMVAAWSAAGFWWFDGLAATRARYVAGVATRRPYAYFALLGNPAAVAVALGPAVAVAFARVRDRRLWVLAGGALAAMAAADLSGLSKGEVERIWLPFVPWVLVLCAGLADRAVSTPVRSLRSATTVELLGPPREKPDAQPRSSGSPSNFWVQRVKNPTLSPEVRWASAPWSSLAGHLLVAQVVVAVLAESVVRTLW